MSTSRTTITKTTTYVSHLASPMGKARNNGPHLLDLREFVAACEGLPDDLFVLIQTGHLGEPDRSNVVFSLSYTHPSGADRILFPIGEQVMEEES